MVSEAPRDPEIKEPVNPFSVIDRHARNTPDAVEVDIRTLANYLSLKSSTDLEKARAIYIWLTDNIAYDDNRGRFTLSYKAHTSGALKVGVKKKGGEVYDILLEYEVVQENELIG